MANNDNVSLTKALTGMTKWTGKTSFVLLIISAILVAATISAGSPNINGYYIEADTPKVLIDFYLSNDNIQFGLASEDRIPVTLTLYRVDGASLEQVISITSHEMGKDMQLDRGQYRFIAEANEAVSFVFGVGEFVHEMVALSSVFLVIFALVFGLFNAVWPFALLILIINAFSPQKGSKPPYPTHYAPAQAPQAPQATQAPVAPVSPQPQEVPVLKPKPKAKSKEYFHPDSWFAKLTQNDWIALAVAAFFLIMAPVNPGGPFFFFAVVISIVTVYSVNERERTKNRLLVLLNHYPVSSVDFLTQQLFDTRRNKDRYVIKVLRIMIMDDGLPLQLNMQSRTVKVVGDLPQNPLYSAVTSHPATAPAPVAPTAPVTPVEPTTPVVAKAPAEEPVQDEEPVVKAQVYHCTGCGERLAVKTKYCYACGQKTDF